MNAKSVVSVVRYVLRRHLTNLALQPVSMTYVSQVLPLEVLRQISRFGKVFGTLLAQALDVDSWPLLLQHTASITSFSASAAATCGSTSLARADLVDSWNWHYLATALMASLRRRISSCDCLNQLSLYQGHIVAEVQACLHVLVELESSVRTSRL